MVFGVGVAGWRLFFCFLGMLGFEVDGCYVRRRVVYLG